MRRVGAAVGRVLLLFVRWYFGVAYVVGGVVCVIAGLVAIAAGYAAFYLLIVGPFSFALGWVIHPSGLQRTARREAEGYDRTSALLPDRWENPPRQRA
jgi:hypothetical protein